MRPIPLLINTFITFLILVLKTSILHAGGDFRSVGARSSALGNTSICSKDVWATFNNQAALAFLTNPSAGIFFENRYLVKELNYNAASFGLPIKKGTIAASASYFGFQSWNESKIGVAYSRLFGNKIAIGAQLDYFMINQPEFYGKLDYITFEVGILASLNEKLSLGIHAFNPINAEISPISKERSHSSLRLGIGYKTTECFSVYSEIEKNGVRPLQLKAGVELKVNEILYLRSGICTNPSLWSFGAGIKFQKIILDFSSSYHQVLGYSPQISAIYSW